MRLAILTLLSWAALSGAAFAQKTGYHCTVKGASEREWIQPVIFIARDSETDRVVVSDAAILGFNGGVPVEGKLVKDNAARTTFSWIVEMRSAANQRVKMSYRATYLKSSGKMNITAQPRGYEGMFNRMGTCKVSKL
ncbi:hypothetical protein [Antarctobacter jejuensis]|uniref:hypothetical protein n=1 Tax=Antarctobacter jejuensis TaxID=1439938 RepID=UPI003FD3A614